MKRKQNWNTFQSNDVDFHTKLLKKMRMHSISIRVRHKKIKNSHLGKRHFCNHEDCFLNCVLCSAAIASDKCRFSTKGDVPALLCSFQLSFFHFLFSEKKEPYPAFQSLVASLTAGPVAFADGIGKTDKDLLMRCYCWIF